jgi:hypothetical protein
MRPLLESFVLLTGRPASRVCEIYPIKFLVPGSGIEIVPRLQFVNEPMPLLISLRTNPYAILLNWTCQGVSKTPRLLVCS